MPIAAGEPDPQHFSLKATRRVGAAVADPSSETRRLYASDWASFDRWCRGHALPALPAAGSTLAAFLLFQAAACSRGTLRRRRAAIAAAHRERGHPVPMLDRDSQDAVRRASRTAQAARPSSAPTPAALTRLAATLPRHLPGLRDRAMLLLLAVAGQGRPPVTRTALLGLDAEHVRFTPKGAELRLRARADEAEPSLLLPLARSATPTICAVRALEDWLTTSDTAFGPVWRKVTRWGSVEHARLGPDGWRRILQRHAGKAGRHR